MNQNESPDQNGSNPWTIKADKASEAKLRWLRALFLVLVVAAGVYYCFPRDKNIHFTEEVQLASGEIISVERFIKAAPLGEVGGPGGWESAYQSFEMVDQQQTGAMPRWESTAGLIPILFDHDPANNEWVLLATFYTCDGWYKLGRPKHPYAEFRVRDGQWQKVELSDQWFGRAANVFTRIRSSGEPSRITLTDKKQRASGTAAPEYRSIVSNWRTAC